MLLNKEIIKKNAKWIALIAVLITILIGVAQGENNKYDTNIILDVNQPNILVINKKTTTIVSGIAKNDMDSLNRLENVEVVKSYMRQLGDEYGVDWKLVYAIGYHESGNFNSALARNNNNFFGRKASSGGYASWETPADGIRNQFEYLKNRYFDRGMDTPAKINPVYAEDSGWHYKVESLMVSL